MIVRLPYRATFKTPARTQCHVLSSNGEVIKPVHIERSRTGAHGFDIYDVQSPVYIVEYYRSGSGKEHIYISKVDEKGERRSLEKDQYPECVVKFLDEKYPKWRYFQ
ncbi:MAG: hypothetical protein QXX41_08295 [Nitrososphaerota archaeon]